MTLLTANDLLATREWLQAVHSTLGSYDMSSLSVDVALGVMERAVKSVTDSQKVLRELALVLGQMETGR